MSQASFRKPSGSSWNKFLLISLMDVLSISASFFFALWLRFDFQFSSIPSTYLNTYLSVILIWCAVSVGVFAVCNLYNSIWVFVSMDEVLRIFGAYLILAVLGFVVVLVTKLNMPRSFLFGWQ